MMQGISVGKRTALPNEKDVGRLCDAVVRCGCYQALVCGVVKLRLAIDATPAEVHIPSFFTEKSSLQISSTESILAARNRLALF
jgi:hypothetical protein